MVQKRSPRGDQRMFIGWAVLKGAALIALKKNSI
jgi:hypothetical protein